jgi:hypothetical protein
MTTAKVQARAVHRKEAVREAQDPAAPGPREVMMTTVKAHPKDPMDGVVTTTR